MNRYAYLMGGAAFYVTESEESPGPGWIEVGDDVENGDRHVNGQWFKPGTTREDVKSRCLSELAESDKRVTRALEESGEVPQDLKQYREALRQIYRDGSAPAEWPTPPQYAPKG